MKRKAKRSLALLCGLAASFCAPAQSVIVPIEQAAFEPIIPDRPTGPQIAVLWGDPATGPSAMLMRLQKGSIPLHTHSSDYHLVILEGTMKHWDRGQTEADATALHPGSYYFQPGTQAHAGACLTDECLLHIVWSHKRDAAPAAP